MISKYKGKTVHVDIAAPAAERWREAIPAIGDSLHELIDDLEEELGDLLISCEGIPLWMRNLIQSNAGAASQYTSMIGTLTAALSKHHYVKEIRGIAKGVGIPTGKVFIANIMYDLSQIAGAHACSSYSFNLRGVPTLVRNMDWALPASVGKHTVVTEFHRGNSSYTGIGVAGLTGILSAINKDKWAVTLNQAPSAGRMSYSHIPALHGLREVCDKMINNKYTQFAKAIEKCASLSPFFAHVVGAKPTQHCVISKWRNTHSRYNMPKDKKYIVQANHHKGTLKLEGFNDDEGEEYIEDSVDRCKIISRRLNRSLPLKGKVFDKLKGYPVTSEYTQQQMMLIPKTGELQLKIRT